MRKQFYFLTFFSFFYFTTANAQTRIQAKEYAFEAAKRMQRSVSPNTGKNASAIVSEIEFDSYNKQYVIEMEASWIAGICTFCDDEYFSVKGILTVGLNGSFPSFKELSRNDAARRAWTDGQVALVIGGVSNILSTIN